MHDLRLRMVLLGLVLGVIVAVVFAANGCGSNRTRKHGGGHRGQVVALTEKFRAAPAQSTSFRRSVHAARRSDASGPFFGFRHAHMTRVDAPEQRAVALTFDDGPGPATGQIVGELRALHARATFFVVGTMAAIRPDMVRAERQAGMEVGNHTWTHPAMPTLTAAAQRLEIQRTNELLAHITGRRPRFFRPPNWRVGQRTAGIVARERMIGVLRTVDTRDWTLPGTGAIVRRALRVRPGGIVAMHDAGGYTRAQTVAAVPAIVRGLRRRHLRPVTVGQLYAGRR